MNYFASSLNRITAIKICLIKAPIAIFTVTGFASVESVPCSLASKNKHFGDIMN